MTQSTQTTTIVDLLKTDGFFEDFSTPKDFIDAIDIIIKKPYVCKVYGEYLENIFKIRRKFAEKYLGIPNKSTNYDEVKFGAWLLFKQKNVVYTTITVIKSFCSKYNLDLEYFMDHMIQHPKHPKLYTNSHVREAEISICNWLNKTCVIVPDVENMIINTQFDALDEKQTDSIRNILRSRYSILQGNAGCGKTRTICELIKLLTTVENIDVHAAAFTHKAKNCMIEKLRSIHESKYNTISVSTVHSLIGKLNMTSTRPMFLILDEASMLDIDFNARV